MKRVFILFSAVALMFGTLFTSCDNAEYPVKDNSVYIAQAALGSTGMIVAMETAGANINIVVRLAKPADHDVEVELALAPGALEAYNTANDAACLLLPSEHYQMDNKKVTIPAGEVSATLLVHVDNFDVQGKRYALPVVIDKVVKGKVDKSTTQSTFVYLIAKPLITSVPVMRAIDNVGVRAQPYEPWGVKTAQWSLEVWIRMDGYTRNNQCIFDNRKEIYIRFGDANAPYNYLQIKFLGDGGKETARDLVPNVWYHWAYVWDGNMLILYRNGEEDFRYIYPPPEDGLISFDELWWISSSANYFYNYCSMSQMRLWGTAISQNQIKNNMYFEVDPDDPNLIGYWPMNEGEGQIFHDISGNGHDAIASISGTSNTINRWEHNIRFDK